MSLNQENIIKDKLLDYEVPFEEKYWTDFKKKLDEDQGHKPVGPSSWNKGKFIGLAAGLVILSFLFFKKDKGDLALLDQKPATIEQVSNDANITPVVTEEDQKETASISNASTNKSNKNYTPSSNADNALITNTNTAGDALIADNQNNNTNNDELTTISESANVSKINRKRKRNRNNGTTAQNASKLNKNKAGSVTTIPFISNSTNGTSSLDRSGISGNSAAVTGPSGILTTLPEHVSAPPTYSQIDGPVNNGLGMIANDNNSKGLDVSTVSDIENYSNAMVHIDRIDRDNPDPAFRIDNISNGTEDIDWDFAKPKRWEVGAYGGIGLNIGTKYSGIISDYNIKGRRPNITAGAYFMYSVSKRLSVETAFQYKSIEDNFSSRYKYTDNDNLLELTETTIVNRLTSVEFPIGINYKLNDWLYFSTGMSFAYVKPASFINDLEERNEGSQNIEDFYFLAKQDNFGLRKFDARVYAGLTFHVSPFIGFRFNVNQGLVDRTKNDYYFTDQYNVHTDYTFSTIIRLNSKVLK